MVRGVSVLLRSRPEDGSPSHPAPDKQHGWGNQSPSRAWGPYADRAATAEDARNGMCSVTASPLAIAHRELIIALSAQHRLPAVYFDRVFAKGGGLISYGPDIVDQYRRAAGHVDRILKGEKPADLPVQAPTKYQLIINLNTAKALGLTIPPGLLAIADEVIE